MQRWLNDPDVSPWYAAGKARNPTLEQVIDHYAPAIREERPTKLYSIRYDGRPIGLIQAYRTGDYATYAAELMVDPEAWGIDLFIGEEGYRDRGLGPAVLRAFLEREVFSRPGVELAVIAPLPDNKRAIRAYEKAGFRHLKNVWVSYDEAWEYLMVMPKAAVNEWPAGGTN